MPTQRLLTAMGEFNESLVKAGILLAGKATAEPARQARALLR